MALGVAAVGVLAGALVPVGSAVADTAPTNPSDPGSPTTVSSDVLPTPQIGDGTSDGANDTKGAGVAWDQVVVGDTVYVGGNFQFARPAGAKAGEKVVPRSNFLAYNLKTGALLDYAPSFNGQIRSLAVSPDGNRLYVGGTFTQVNGAARTRLAALDVATGNLDATFAPYLNAGVSDVSVSSTTVYVTGALTAVQNQSRQNFAAFDRGTGAVLPWAPKPAAGGGVTGLTGKSVLVSPDEKKVIVAGNFWTMNGSSAPGRGMAALDATTAGILPWKVNSTLKNGTTDKSSFMDLTSDGTSIYGAGYQNGPGDGLFEGTFRASWTDGSLQWMTNCHGDSYSIAASEGAVYTASHAHYCGGIGAFADGTTSVGSDQFHRALAFSNEATQKLTAYTGPNSAYNSHTGQPGPSLLDWYPDFGAGAFTGMSQGPWDVAAAQGYVLYAGEFPTVNGVAQRGLARFAPKTIAPNKQGPQLSGAGMTLTPSAWGNSYVKFTWPANYDRDNARLTYQLIRDDRTDKPVFETAVESRFWKRPTISAVDGYLEPGSTHTYQLRVIDPFGNAQWGNKISYTAPSSTRWAPDMVTPYDKMILQQQPESYWSMNELNGDSTTIYDWTKTNSHLSPLTAKRVIGVDPKDTGAAVPFTGRAVPFAAGQKTKEQKTHAAPVEYSSEVWFQSTSKTGGTLLSYVAEGETDRVVKLGADGRLGYWVYPGKIKEIISPKSYTDGAWHHVVATLGPKGTQLYVDGELVASDATSTTAYTYPSGGSWALGGAAATLDNAAVWHRVLSASEVSEHYRAVVPTASPSAVVTPYDKMILQQRPESYWSMNEVDGYSTTIFDWTEMNNHFNPLTAARVAGVDTRDAGRAVPFAAGQKTKELKTHAAPGQYSSEVWFQSTSKTGGTLLSYVAEGETDRVIRLAPDGKLAYWVWPGKMKEITSPKSYADGAWHHVVATLGPKGTQLYVDGQLVVADATSTTAYTYPSGGSWALGGAAATLDNAAVWHRVLSASEVSEHYRAGGAAAPNANPVASFTAAANGLTATVDGSGSSDADGKVASYAWNFGDGSTGTGVTAPHAYAKAGTYTVTLTVTDDKGATATTSKQVVVSSTPVPPAPAGVVAEDAFERSAASGWGSASTGGAWTTGGGAAAVTGGVGTLTGAKAQTTTAVLQGAVSDSTDSTVSFRLDNAPTGGGQYVWVTGRQVGSESYMARVRVQASGVLQLELKRSGTLLSTVNLTGVTYKAGDVVNVRFQVSGTGTTTLSAKAWTTGAEPAAWTKTMTDTTAALQKAGTVGLGLYVSGSATAASTVSFDNYTVKKATP